MQHPELPVFSFISALLVILPLSCHWPTRNVAVLALMSWLFIANIIYGINSLVWAGNIRNSVPVWCDITTKIIVGVSYAVPLCTLCICRHLEMVSSSRKVSYDDPLDRKRRMIFEAIMCFLLPMVFMALHYIVQSHRFDIFEDIGCQAAMYISIEAILIIWFPQLLFFIIAFIFATLALHKYFRRRFTFDLHLHQTNSSMSTNRYIRLIAMALVEMILGTSLTAFNLSSNVSVGLRPWISWGNVHSNFSRVGLFPTSALPPHRITNMMITWWTVPVSSIIFFAFFGFGDEALKEYKKVWVWIKVKVFKRPMSHEKRRSFFGGPLLRNFKSTTSSSSRDFGNKSISSLTTTVSHQSIFPQSTITLASPLTKPSFLNKPITRITRSKDEEASITYTQSPSQELVVPAYCTPYPCSYPEVYIASPEHPTTDDTDTFSISTFSYYSGTPSPSTSSRLFELSQTSVEQPQGLSPPPVFPIIKRPIPKDMPSSVSADSVDSLSRYSSSDLDVPTTLPQEVKESLLNGKGLTGIMVTTVRKQSFD